MDFDELHSIATSFPEVTVEPHFNRIAFKIRKKIFLTYDSDTQETNLPLSLEQQAEFCENNPESFKPLDNKWGEKGWTSIILEEVKNADCEKAIEVAYQNKSRK